MGGETLGLVLVDLGCAGRCTQSQICPGAEKKDGLSSPYCSLTCSSTSTQPSGTPLGIRARARAASLVAGQKSIFFPFFLKVRIC